MQRFAALLLIPLIAQAECPNWTDTEARQKLEQLNHEVLHHNELYFLKQMPVLSDHEYDALAKRLQTLSACFSDIELNAAAPERLSPDIDGKRRIRHLSYMGSLSKADSEQDIIDFLKLMQNAAKPSQVMVQPKIDGIAIELVYRDGKLVAASTRGDGATGNNILTKVKAIPAIPNEIVSAYTEIILHGELFVRLDLWNDSKDSKGRYSSARHFVAGTINAKSPELNALETLDFFPWRWINSPADSEAMTANQLYTLGFDLPTIFTEPVKTIEDVRRIRSQLEQQANKLPFLLDGVVLKANDYSIRKELGWSNDTPNWAMAWKFAPDVAVSTVTDIEFNIGRTGNITPVIIFKPVTIKQETISRASLSSLNNLQSQNVAIGDEISIQLKGSATPVFHRVVIRDENRRLPPLPAPDRYNAFTCLSVSQGCEQQFMARSRWLAKRLSLPGLDEPAIRSLVTSGHIQTLADVLRLNRQQLLEAGISQEQAGYIRSAIELAASTPFEQQIRALGIPDIGAGRSRKLAKRFPDWDHFLKAEDKQFEEAAGIGQQTVESLRRYLETPEIQALIKTLKHLSNRQ